MTPRRYDHVIWDWNGTLLDDVALCVDVMNALLRRRSMPEIDAARHRETFAFPVETYYRTLGFDFRVEPFERLAAEYCAAYDSRSSECPLQGGSYSALQAVAEDGAAQSILSSAEQQALLAAICHFELRDRFEAIVGQTDYYAVGKIEAGRTLIQKSGVAPDRTLLVGDTLHDYEVAQALGLRCVLVSNGHHSRERLEAVHDRVFDSLDELMGRLL
jgi:phosphoglycolate phosphatase